MSTKRMMEDLRRSDGLLARAAERLAEAAINQRMLDNDENLGLDDSGGWIEETTALLFEIADVLDYDRLALNGTFTELGSHLASLEGWNLFNGGAGEMGEIQRDDEAENFGSDDAAIEWVRSRATSGATGSKLHQIALAIHQAGKRQARKA